MGEYIPAFAGLWDNRGYFGASINAQFDPEIKIQYASITDLKKPLLFSGKAESLRIGPELTLLAQPYSGGTNDLLDRLGLKVTYHPWYDTFASPRRLGSLYWWSNSLTYRLDADGNFGVALSYDRGLDEELSPNLGDERGSGGSGLSLRSDDLYSIVELYTEDDFRQLVVAAETIPIFLGGLCELEDHGDGGLVREATPRSDRSMPDGGERTFDRVCRA